MKDQQLVPESDILSGASQPAEQEATEKEEDKLQNAHKSDAPKIDIGHPTETQFAPQTVSTSLCRRPHEILSRESVYKAQSLQFSEVRSQRAANCGTGYSVANRRKYL